MIPLGSELAALSVLVVLTSYAGLVDLKCMVIPDKVCLALFVTGLATAFLLPIVTPASALLASAAGGGFLFFIETGFRRYRGYDGLGRGDVKFVGGSATWIGLEGLPLALLVASLTALAYVAFRCWRDGRLERTARIPFGPFLGLGVVTVAGAQFLSGLTVLDLIDAGLRHVALLADMVLRPAHIGLIG